MASKQECRFEILLNVIILNPHTLLNIFYDTESTEQTRFRAPGLVGCKKGHYCKYRLQNHYSDKNNNHNIMQLGPFPGDLRKMTMIAFMYKHVDVLCLDTLSKQTSIYFTFLNITKH